MHLHFCLLSKRYLRTVKFLFWSMTFLTLGAGLTACSGGSKSASGGASQLSVSFPTTAQLQSLQSRASQAQLTTSSVSAMSTYDFTRACFALNVTGSGITPTGKSGACSIPLGVFQGFVAPGGSTSISIPQGSARTLQVLAYARSSSTDPCPTGLTDVSGLDLSKLSVVGTVASFDALTASVDVNITLSVPSGNIVSQLAMPATCRPANAPANATAAFVAGRAVQTGGSYKIVATAGGLKNELTLSGGNYKIRLSRRAQ